MPRILATTHEAALSTAGKRSTLKITLGDSTELFFSTADTTIGSDIYLGKLAPSDDLNLEATQASEGINFKISAVHPELRQSLINTPDVLTNAKAVLGAYFWNELGEWHDIKLTGKLTVGEIDGQWINVFFESTVSSKIWNGVTIASLFPEEEIPTAELPAQNQTPPPSPVYNDLNNVPIPGNSAYKLAPILGDPSGLGRYFLPDAL